jgi:hypothetical protein
MRQKLCRRLEEQDKISAATAARRGAKSPGHEATIARITAQAQAWHAVPENQAWLAEQPPDFLFHRVQSLRARLAEIAYGRTRSVYQGGY